MPSRPSPAATLERALATKRILVACGSGGVGKTTTAAALALRAARSGRRVLVCTIDPSRRLATSLGLNQLSGKPRAIELSRLAPPPARGGALWAMVLDVKSTFDALVARHTPDAAARERILGNRFYRHISAALAGSHEYMAMEKLLELSADERWDLVVLDTPPTRHALDFLEAPDRLVDFLDTSVLRWFLRPYFVAGRLTLKVATRTGAIAFRLADRFLGLQFLQDLSEFFLAFESMYDGFKERASEGARAAARAVLGLRDGGGPDRARARGGPLLPPAAHGEADALRRLRREPRAHRPRARGPLAAPGALRRRPGAGGAPRRDAARAAGAGPGRAAGGGAAGGGHPRAARARARARAGRPRPARPRRVRRARLRRRARAGAARRRRSR